MNQNEDIGFKGVLGHFKNYFSARIAIKALAFISIPVMTRLLSPTDYGLIAVFMGYIGVLSVVMTLNTHTAVGRYFFELEKDLPRFLGTSLILSLGILALCAIPFLFFLEEFSGLMSLPMKMAIFILPVIFLKVIASSFSQLFQAMRQSAYLSKINVLQAYLGLGLTISLVLLLDDDLFMAAVYSQITMMSLFGLYFIYKLRGHMRLDVHKADVIYILNWTLPQLPKALSGIILGQFDRIMINDYLGASEAGLYSFAYKLGALALIFIGTINTSWMPDSFKLLNEENYHAYEKGTDKVLRMIVLTSLGVMLFGKELGVLLAAKSFHHAVGIIPIVVLGFFFFGVSAVYGRLIGFQKKTLYIMLTVLIPGLLNIYWNSIYIPRYGYVAGAYTTLASYMLMAILPYVFNKYVLKGYSVPLKILLLPLTMMGFGVAGYYWAESLDNFILLLAAKGLVFAIGSFILLYPFRKQIYALLPGIGQSKPE